MTTVSLESAVEALTSQGAVDQRSQRLLTCERLFYRAPVCDVIMMARFRNSIPVELLRSALAKARLKYPLIGARIEQDERGNARFVLDGVPEFPLKVMGKRTDDEWVELAWGEQKKPFDLSKGPLIKFVLLSS